ncbi:hypothetical protein [Rhizobium sp. R693]|uniref:hypothetical protein n=1 Tax=Rhizobium sp. R693 TaxID=1764276 RepID=UPI000B5383E1|nr:hypothetical protein [Rhizobium sp. R693]OWV82707.1 hypothetical protein ATY79_15030 [Rhizobium sp. R693]
MSSPSEMRSHHHRLAQSIWSVFTRKADGLPVSRKACAILLSLVTVQPPRAVLLMRLEDIDLNRWLWHVPPLGDKRSYAVPLTRLAIALVGHAFAFRTDGDGEFLFPGRRDASIPMARAVLTRTFRRAKLAPTPQFRRPGYDLPVIAAVVMSSAGVDALDIRAVMHRISQHETLRITKFEASDQWILKRSRAALAQFETELMKLVGLKYTDPIFCLPRGFPGPGMPAPAGDADPRKAGATMGKRTKTVGTEDDAEQTAKHR